MVMVTRKMVPSQIMLTNINFQHLWDRAKWRGGFRPNRKQRCHIHYKPLHHSWYLSQNWQISGMLATSSSKTWITFSHSVVFDPVSGETKNLNKTETEIFFRYQKFLIPNPILVSIPKFFETDTDTFFGIYFFRNQYQYYLQYHFFQYQIQYFFQ